jgi:putative transposase
MAPSAAPACLSPLGHGLSLLSSLPGSGRLGDHAPPPRHDAARAGRPGAQPDGGHHRHPERLRGAGRAQDDRKGGPRGYDAAKKIKGRCPTGTRSVKRHVAVDSSGFLLGVLVHAASIQDANSAGELLKRIKRLYCRLQTVFADSIYNRLPVLIACFLLGLSLIIVRRIAGSTGFVIVPRRWVAERTLGWLGRWRRLSCPKGMQSIKDYEELPEVSEAMVTLASIRLMLHRLVHPNRKRLPAP